jgi:NitT/TauT family transport system permease protein
MSEQKVPFRGGGYASESIGWASVATLIGTICLWQATASLGWVSTQFASSPAAIITELRHLIASGELWGHLAASLQRLAIGWGIGTVTGLIVGFALGLFTIARSPGLALVSALFPIPKIALVPLFIIWFGIGEGSKIVTLAFGVFFPTVINTLAGVDGVSRGLIRMAQSFNLKPWSIVTKIVLPGATPAILSGFRITTATAVVLLVAAEMIGAERGIGAFVLQAGNLYDTDALLAGIVVLSAIGLVISFVLGRLERALLRWR